MRPTDLIALVTTLGSIMFGLMERWEKIEVARTLSNACEATVRSLLQ